MASRVLPLLQLAALASIASGLVGGCVWVTDLVDRADNDDLRWGFWHNPFMGLHPFSEPFLDASMWVLLACSAAVGLGGLMLLADCRWGVTLVTWQARVSVVIHATVVAFIGLMAFGVLNLQWTGRTLAVRLGAIAVDLILWGFLGGRAVKEHFARASSADRVRVRARRPEEGR